VARVATILAESEADVSYRSFALRVLSVAVIVTILVLVGTAIAAGPAQAKLERYLIISTHTPEQCLSVLDQMEAKAPKLLAKMEWGCMAGDHTGYVQVNAATEEAAREMLPEGARSTAKIIKLNKFTAEQIRQLHTKM
jgi:hypothetical protein